MTDNVTQLIKNRAGQDALTLIYAAALVRDSAISEDIRASAGVLVEISDDQDLAREYASDKKSAIASLMTNRTLRMAHRHDVEGMMEMLSRGPQRGSLVLGHLRLIGEQFPAASLFADTPLSPGQPCVLIGDGAAISYAQSDVPGRLERLGGGPAVLVAQNSDGSVRITDEDGGNARTGVLRLLPRLPEPAPHNDQAEGPSSGP